MLPLFGGSGSTASRATMPAPMFCPRINTDTGTVVLCAVPTMSAVIHHRVRLWTQMAMMDIQPHFASETISRLLAASQQTSSVYGLSVVEQVTQNGLSQRTQAHNPRSRFSVAIRIPRSLRPLRQPRISTSEPVIIFSPYSYNVTDRGCSRNPDPVTSCHLVSIATTTSFVEKYGLRA